MGYHHDQEVLRQARQYQREGYTVEADLNGWTKPDVVHEYLPDLIAWKGGTSPERIIVEVETSLWVNSDHTKSQVEAFKQAAREDPTTTFKLVEIYSRRFHN